MTIHDYTTKAPRAFESTTGTLFTGATLAASGAWTRGEIVSVRGVRRLTMLIDYDPGAIGGYPGILLLGACTELQPVAGDDTWFRLAVTDGSVTSGVLSGALATGADYTVTQPNGIVTAFENAIRLTAATNATDEYRIAVTVDVSAFRWFHIAAAEVGVTATPGALSVLYATAA